MMDTQLPWLITGGFAYLRRTTPFISHCRIYIDNYWCMKLKQLQKREKRTTATTQSARATQKWVLAISCLSLPTPSKFSIKPRNSSLSLSLHRHPGGSANSKIATCHYISNRPTIKTSKDHVWGSRLQ